MLGGVAGIAGIERLFADFKPADDIVGRVAGLPRRVLGRTKQEVSIVVFPGLSLSHEDQDDSNTAIRQAFERGVNYFDVAPAYGRDGECEIKLGIALQQLDRKKVFLACKTKARDRETGKDPGPSSKGRCSG
jgi:aryl-alcohol dehydrogenase-like predicted oxidoreductase